MESRLPRPGRAAHVLPAVFYVMAVFYMGSIPMPELPDVPRIGADKLLHLTTFAGMVWVFVRALRYGAPRLSEAQQRWYSAIAATCVGGILELYQMAIPGRSAEALDWLADAIGSVLAVLIMGSIWRRKGRRGAPDK